MPDTDPEPTEISPAASAPAPATSPSKSEAAIARLEALWAEAVPNTGLARNTRLYNPAFAAKEALKKAFQHIDD